MVFIRMIDKLSPYGGVIYGVSRYCFSCVMLYRKGV